MFIVYIYIYHMVATAFPVFSTKSRIMKVKDREKVGAGNGVGDRQTDRGGREGGW